MPASHCKKCKKTICFHDNIPLLSFLWLKGRCRYCKTIISPRYFLIELLTALVFLTNAVIFGATIYWLAATIFSSYLIIMSFIDFDETILPDILTLQLLWLGLLVNIFSLFATTTDAIIGAFFGYISLWFVNQLFKAIRQQDGMGYGDFKLFAACGAWLGWQFLPLIILIASLLGAMIGIGGIIFFKKKQKEPIPFGPFLAIAGWIALLFGPHLMRWYLTF